MFLHYLVAKVLLDLPLQQLQQLPTNLHLIIITPAQSQLLLQIVMIIQHVEQQLCCLKVDSYDFCQFDKIMVLVLQTKG